MPPTLLRQDAGWPRLAAELGADVGARAMGDAVTDHRSSWVRRLSTSSGTVFAKTYEYASWADRLRDFGHRTAPWGTPRTVREFDALSWLAARGFAAPRPLVALAWRTFGFLTRTVLVTAAFPGQAASTLLPTLATPERIEVARAIGSLLQRLHDLGFRDRNFDLRNLLVSRHANGFTVAKIDSPRFRLRRPGRRHDALTLADWQRITPQLAAFDVDGAAHHAAATTPAPA